MSRFTLKRIFTGLALVAPLLLLLWFVLFPQTDSSVSLPLFHFYIVTFTTFSAAVISILLSVTLRHVAQPRHYLAAVAFAVIGAIFFLHGAATPGALIDFVHPAVSWSAWLTLFGGGVIFAAASLEAEYGLPQWLSIRRMTLFVTLGVALYFAVALFSPQTLEWINANANPWHRQLIFYLTLGLWLAAAFNLGRCWRRTGQRVDGALAFVSLWLGFAAISMHQFPLWQLSWWLYHFILLIAFLVTTYILLAEYEQAREFSLLRYYLATSLIVTALMALAASYLFSQFAAQLLPFTDDLNQTILQARRAGLLITALSMSVLFGFLLLIVARADGIIAARTQELAQAYQNLRQSEAMRSDLTNMVVHDLRNPLSIIYGTLGMVQTLNDNPTFTAKRAEYIGHALYASERMTGLIDDILAVSKIEAGQFEPVIQPTPVAEMLSARLEGFSVHAAEEQKQVSLDCPAELTAPLDANLIGRVVDNLVSNALKYTDAGGQVQVAAWADNGRVHFRVRDNGEGIPDEYKQQIFEKFGQGPTANRNATRKGTGLGLAFCGMAVQLHHGQIWVDDSPTGGSDFNFWLPQRTQV